MCAMPSMGPKNTLSFTKPTSAKDSPKFRRKDAMERAVFVEAGEELPRRRDFEGASSPRMRADHRAHHVVHQYLSESDTVALYDAAVTNKTQALTAQTKRELWKLRATLNTHGGIPASWKPAEET
jgi:hypothetical protein